VKSSLKNTEDLDHMLKRLFQTIAQGNAEMAVRQEQAMEVAASYTRSQVQNLHHLTGETGATISELRDSVVSNVTLNKPRSNPQ
jgi:ABC-type siderophore export system fused ATPase/permease subunit